MVICICRTTNTNFFFSSQDFVYKIIDANGKNQLCLKIKIKNSKRKKLIHQKNLWKVQKEKINRLMLDGDDVL